MSHAATTKNDAHAPTTSTATHKADAKAGAKGAQPRDAAADAQKLLLLLAADWLNNDRTHSKEIGALLAAMTAAQGPPTVVDVPHAQQAGATLTCTMGNWQGEPTGYAYAWYIDGVAKEGATSATYAVQPDDVGKGAGCIVTATNALGETAAPMSNSVTVT
jgi:hypothetical protein